ncbi:MAG: FprA family A-type flavoprotein [Muribaculaceae bacterium]|nr:FprA family A-type flavoprotein [Muribaculaceae bacterium]
MNREVRRNILAVGVEDAGLDMFENQYPLTSGVTYNSYVIRGGSKTAVIDAVDRRCTRQWLDLVAEAAPLGVDYLIVQHMEPDHSASIGDFMARYPKAVVVGSAQALKILGQFFPDIDFSGRTLAVGEGDVLQIGSEELQFFGAPMVHWPEVMVSYHRASHTLFSADGFGTFGIGDDGAWPDEARRYYANIVGKYGAQVDKLITKVARLEGVERLCPLHGPILEGADLQRALELYGLWSSYRPEEPQGVLVAYASIYGHTARVALSVAAALEQRGIAVTTVDLCRTDVSYAVGQAFRMGRIVCASPTYDAGVFPAMHDFLYHLQIKGLRNRTFGLIENGSWAPAAARQMAAMIAAMRDCTVIESVLTIRSAANSETPAAITAFINNLLAH